MFIISSKSFSTVETLTNAHTIQQWMQTQMGEIDLTKHFVAVTAAAEKALQFGIAADNIFPIWNWVGGRYSIWSAIGLPLALMIGYAHFDAFLEGAYEMDQHFLQAKLTENMPILLALLGIWYVNFFDAKAQAIVPYSLRLRQLVSYLQQAEMESNGKIVKRSGISVNYSTCPIIFR